MDIEVMNRKPEYWNCQDGSCAEYKLLCYADDIRKMLLMLADELDVASCRATEGLKGNHKYKTVLQWYTENFRDAFSHVENIEDRLEEIVGLYANIDAK